jgi:hypothetical protein
MSSWTLLPVMLLSPPGVQTPRPSVRRIVGSAVVLPLVILIAAPAIALVLHERGIPPELAHARMLTEQVQNAWHDATAKPLRYVGGDVADGVAAYAQSRPQLLSDFPEWHTKRVMESGMALVCFAEDSDCIAAFSTIASGNPNSRQIETQLVRYYLGIPGQPQRYVIFIVPPAS